MSSSASPSRHLHPLRDSPSHRFPNVAVQLTLKGKLQPPALKQLLAHMAAEGSAAPDPPKQATTYLLYWRKPEEWGQLIYDWVRYCELELERECWSSPCALTRAAIGTFMRSPVSRNEVIQAADRRSRFRTTGSCPRS